MILLPKIFGPVYLNIEDPKPQSYFEKGPTNTTRWKSISRYRDPTKSGEYLNEKQVDTSTEHGYLHFVLNIQGEQATSFFCET